LRDIASHAEGAVGVTLEEPHVDALSVKDVVALEATDHAIGFERLKTNDAVSVRYSAEILRGQRSESLPFNYGARLVGRK
jgi:hypothetical protein